MKKAAVFSAVMLIALGFFAVSFFGARAEAGRPSSSIQAPAPTPQKPRLPRKVNSFADKRALIKFLQQLPAYPEKFISLSGLGAAESDLVTKEAWVTAIGDGRNPEDRAEAGFYTVTVENTSGVAWKATIKATFDVSMVQGQVELGIFVLRDRTNFDAPNLPVSSPGTYNVTTQAFDIEPNQKYTAFVRIACKPPKDQAAAGKAKIQDIKWNIEL